MWSLVIFYYMYTTNYRLQLYRVTSWSKRKPKFLISLYLKYKNWPEKHQKNKLYIKPLHFRISTKSYEKKCQYCFLCFRRKYIIWFFYYFTAFRIINFKTSWEIFSCQEDCVIFSFFCEWKNNQGSPMKYQQLH